MTSQRNKWALAILLGLLGGCANLLPLYFFDLEKLNKSNLKSQLSVVMLTGDDSEEVISKINRLGVDDYLIKPVKKK